MWQNLEKEKENEATRKELKLEKVRLEVELRKTAGESGLQVAGQYDLHDMTILI